jgi:hypothetical protein
MSSDDIFLQQRLQRIPAKKYIIYPIPSRLPFVYLSGGQLSNGRFALGVSSVSERNKVEQEHTRCGITFRLTVVYREAVYP